ELYGRLPGLDIMLHSQINAHKESLPFLMSKKWEAVQRLSISIGAAYRIPRIRCADPHRLRPPAGGLARG
ncbi:hypothetical protein DXA64_07065, partial [Collinsella sp. OF03-4AA]